MRKQRDFFLTSKRASSKGEIISCSRHFLPLFGVWCTHFLADPTPLCDREWPWRALYQEHGIIFRRRPRQQEIIQYPWCSRPIFNTLHETYTRFCFELQNQCKVKKKRKRCPAWSSVLAKKEVRLPRGGGPWRAFLSVLNRGYVQKLDGR